MPTRRLPAATASGCHRVRAGCVEHHCPHPHYIAPCHNSATCYTAVHNHSVTHYGRSVGSIWQSYRDGRACGDQRCFGADAHGHDHRVSGQFRKRQCSRHGQRCACILSCLSVTCVCAHLRGSGSAVVNGVLVVLIDAPLTDDVSIVVLSSPAVTGSFTTIQVSNPNGVTGADSCEHKQTRRYSY